MPRALSILSIAGLLWLAVPSSAGAAAPRYIVVTGEAVPEPVLLDDWEENFVLTVAFADEDAAPVGRDRLEGRPLLRVLMLWGPWPQDFEPPPTSGNQFVEWISDAPEHRFYPAVGGQPALLMGPSGVARVASTEALAVFERHGVPTKLDGAAARDDEPPWATVAALALAVTTAALALGSRWATRRG